MIKFSEIWNSKWYEAEGVKTESSIDQEEDKGDKTISCKTSRVLPKAFIIITVDWMRYLDLFDAEKSVTSLWLAATKTNDVLEEEEVRIRLR